MSATKDIFFRIIFVLLLIRIHGFRRHPREINVENVEKQSHHSSSAHFGYSDTEEWARDNPSCRGLKQSPIDLTSYDMARLEVPSPLNWEGYERIPTKMTLQNNGHTVEVAATWNDGEIPQISGGVLDGEYTIAQLHFHWGPRDDAGSEHTINNHSLPLEMHMVHYKKEYGSMRNAMKYEDGLAVVGVLFEIDRKRNRALSALQDYASSIKNPGSQVDITPFPLSEFNVHFSDKYVAYSGSLTTPPCSEIVTWILPATAHFLTPNQMNFFREIQLSSGKHNYRPTMPRNGRMIYYISH